MRSWMRLFILRRHRVGARSIIFIPKVRLRLSPYPIPSPWKIYLKTTALRIAQSAASSNLLEVSPPAPPWPHPPTTTSLQTELYNPPPLSTSNTTTRFSPWPNNPHTTIPNNPTPTQKPTSTHSASKPPKNPSKNHFPSRPTVKTRPITRGRIKSALKKGQCSPLKYPNSRAGYRRSSRRRCWGRWGWRRSSEKWICRLSS